MTNSPSSHSQAHDNDANQNNVAMPRVSSNDKVSFNKILTSSNMLRILLIRYLHQRMNAIAKYFGTILFIACVTGSRVGMTYIKILWGIVSGSLLRFYDNGVQNYYGRPA